MGNDTEKMKPAAMRDLISKRTRNEFRETLVGWTLREIEIEFDSEGFKPDLDYSPACSGQRRSYVEQFYKNIDFTSLEQIGRVLRVYETIIATVNTHSPDHARRLVNLLERDGFKYLDGHFVAPINNAAVQHVRQLATELTADEILNQIRRIESGVESDPALAIGTAKELVESCCKTILARRGVAIARGTDLPELLKMTLKVLQLVPDHVPDSAKGADAIRKMLRSLGVVVDGMAEIRNLYGSGHGKEGRTRGLSARHARLAVGAASTLTTFLFETDSARTDAVPSPKATA